MATTFHPIVRTFDKELNPVHILIVHNRKVSYIPTTQLCHKSNLDKEGKISDITILSNSYTKIKEYSDRLNNYDTSKWTVQEIKDFLLSDTDDICFTDFAINFIKQMRNDGRDKPANNYQTSLNSFLKSIKKEKLFISDITSKEIKKWIKLLSRTARAKQMYPIILKAIFDAACEEYNDYERGILRIKTQPFKNVKIPDSDKSRERFIEIEILQKLFSSNTKQKITFRREELGIDVAMLVFFLAGINTVDLYNLEKKEFRNGKLCYNRTKEESVRDDKAYFEITVPNEILYIIKKYEGKNKTSRGQGRLFCFADMYSNADCFSTAVRKGLESLCKKIEIEKITPYFFRHTWANTSKKHCDATTAEIAFCLNHASEHKVTELYFKKDFSSVDKLNREVINYIFQPTNK